MSKPAVSRNLPPLMIESATPERTLLLRPLDVTDCSVVRGEIEENGEHLKRFMPWAHQNPTLEGSVAFFASWRCDYFSGRSFNLGIFDQGGAFLGVIGLVPGNRLNVNCYEVGYWVAKQNSNQGIGTQALKTVILLSFHCFDVDRLEVLSSVVNEASQSLIEKCGFVKEGELKNILQKHSDEMIKDGYSAGRDAILYSLVPKVVSSLSWVEEMRGQIKLTPIKGEPFSLSLSF